MSGKRHSLAFRCRSLSSELPYLQQENLPLLTAQTQSKSVDAAVLPIWHKQFRISYSTLAMIVIVWPLAVMHIFNLFGTSFGLEMDMPQCVAVGKPNLSQAPTQHDSRPEIYAFIGVQTGYTENWANPRFFYEKRRDILRRTWFPANKQAMDRLLEDYGFVMRFVIGQTDNETQQVALEAEIASTGPMFKVKVQEGYLNLARKSHIFFTTVIELYNAKFILKMDDDVYFRPDRLYHALPGYEDRRLGYIGCMKTGPVVTNETQRWFEPSHMLLGSGTYHKHANGPVYILSGQAAQLLTGEASKSFRYFVSEDVTIGSWMLVFNTTYFNDPRLCTDTCSPYTIAQYDYKCQGVCSPTDLLMRHRSQKCRSATLTRGRTSLSMMPAFRVAG